MVPELVMLKVPRLVIPAKLWPPLPELVVKLLPAPVTAANVKTLLVEVKVRSPAKLTAPVNVCNPEVVMLPAKVLVPLTTKLEAPVLLLIAGLVPLMLKLPTVMARCKLRVALLMVKALTLFPKVPLVVTVKVPALIVVLPP